MIARFENYYFTHTKKEYTTQKAAYSFLFYTVIEHCTFKNCTFIITFRGNF
jgi:hypothetical protein